jgi:regulator of sigma E protease
MGHFLAAHLFGIPTPTFSLGFGPAVIQLPIGQTSFQLAILPIGGYVEINQEILAQQPYLHKIVVALAGIAFNIMLAGIIMLYYRYKKITKAAAQSFSDYFSEQTQSRTFIGPIGLINIIGKSFYYDKQLFILILGLISLNIGLLNLLPLPFLDGGQVLIFTLQTLMGNNFPSALVSVISFILLVLFIMFISCISIKDIKNVR